MDTPRSAVWEDAGQELTPCSENPTLPRARTQSGKRSEPRFSNSNTRLTRNAVAMTSASDVNVNLKFGGSGDGELCVDQACKIFLGKGETFLAH